MRRAISERPGDPAERTEAGVRPIAHAVVAPDDDHRIRLFRAERAHMVEQRTPPIERRRFVRPEAARLAAGEDRREDQADRSTRTGTDLPAGTWLCSALCVTGISTLHSG